MQRFGILAVAALALFAAPSARGEDVGYAMYTQWDDIELDQDACKDHAVDALRRASFTADVTRTENSIYARRSGAYTAAVRCIASKKMVFFVISGPKGAITSKYLDELVSKFER
jgi:hypothetical protein